MKVCVRLWLACWSALSLTGVALGEGWVVDDTTFLDREAWPGRAWAQQLRDSFREDTSRGDQLSATSGGDQFSVPSRGDLLSFTLRGDQHTASLREGLVFTTSKGDQLPVTSRGDHISGTSEMEQFSATSRGDQFTSFQRNYSKVDFVDARTLKNYRIDLIHNSRERKGTRDIHDLPRRDSEGSSRRVKFKRTPQEITGRSGPIMIRAGRTANGEKSISSHRIVTATITGPFNRLGPGMGGSAIDTLEASGLQRFATEPAPQTAVLGSIVVLPCRVINKVGQLQWTKDGFGLGNERNLFGFARYSMIGSDDEGDYSLRIQPVLLEDDAHFQCQVSASDSMPGIRSKSVQLTVHVPPDRPLVSPPELETTAGLLSTIECKSVGGRPPPEIQWIDDQHPREPLGLGAVTTMELMADHKRSMVTSKLSFTPRRAHDNSTITCLTSNQALSSPLSSVVRLRVRFAPEVQVTAQPPHRLVEGDDAHFLCQAIANPPQLHYRWYHNTALLPNETSRSLTLPRISRDMHRDSVSCEVSNAVGTSKKSLVVQVRYGPVFRSLPLDAAAETGQEALLRCNVDANPSPSIVWLQEGDDKIIGTGPELRVVASPLTAGQYRCVAGVQERDLQFPELIGKMRVMIKGPPTIVSDTEQMGRLGGTVNLECNTVSVPSPIKVTWNYKGRAVDLEDPRYEVVEEQRTEGLRTILVIHDADQTDFGDYNCSVVNEYGIARKLIRLNEEKRVPVLLLTVGGGAVLVVMVTVAALVICNKRSERDKDSPVPEKIISTPSGPPNMYSAAADPRLTEHLTPSSTPIPRVAHDTPPSTLGDRNMTCNSHTLELVRSPRGRDGALLQDRTTTFSPASMREEDLHQQHSVYLPLLSLTASEHDSLRRGSLSEMSTGGSYGALPPSEPPLPDFCTLRRGVRGPDIISPYHNTNGLRAGNGLRTATNGLRANGDGLRSSSDGLRPLADGLRPVADGLRLENDITHHGAGRYTPYPSYANSLPAPPPYPRSGGHVNHPQSMMGGGGRPAPSDHRQDSDYIFSSDAVMKPGTLV